MLDSALIFPDRLRHDQFVSSSLCGRSNLRPVALLSKLCLATLLGLLLYIYCTVGQELAAEHPAITMLTLFTHPTIRQRLLTSARALQFTKAARSSQYVQLRPTLTRQISQQAAAVASDGPVAGAVTITASQDGEPLGPASMLAPGLDENQFFELDESVDVWKNFQKDGPASALDNLRQASLILSSVATESSEGGFHAFSHGMRTGYFAVNAMLMTFAFDLRNHVFRGKDRSELFQEFLKKELDFDTLTKKLLEAAMCVRQDYHAIKKHTYKPPWDMYSAGHRQQQPQFVAEQTALFVQEGMATLGRLMRGGLEEDKGIWVDSPLYPGYYKNNFHYQTDGWVSSRSAQVYETSTETLFVGRQDAMQRLSLLPLSNVNTHNDAPRILEVACGTGRFATFIRDNHPNAQMTLVDLSPFYLEAARKNDDYWRETRYPDKKTRPPPARFVQAAAEKLPFDDASFDAVVCVYLFHEMPEAERAAAAAEMARVVAPGGIVVLTDSVQRGDRTDLARERIFSNFKGLNEPHYGNYIGTHLPRLFISAGLTCDRKWVESTSKCLSFRKPAQSAGSEETTASKFEDVPSK